MSTSSSHASFMAYERKGRLRSPLAFPQRIESCNRGTTAVHLLETRDAGALLVRENDLEAVPVIVGEVELRSGVRALAATDRASACRPGRQVHIELGHPRPFTVLAAAVERGDPRVLGHGQARLAHLLGQIGPHREGEPLRHDRGKEVVSGARRVASHEHSGARSALRQLGQRALEDLDVIRRGVGAGVSRAKYP